MKEEFLIINKRIEDTFHCSGIVRGQTRAEIRQMDAVSMLSPSSNNIF